MDKHVNTFRMIAKTFAGLEKVLAAEIQDIGGRSVRIVHRGVEFEGDNEILYKANYLCRSALRIIKPIAELHTPNENVLYEEIKKMPWEQYLDISTTFSIDGITSYSNITHSKYLALKTKDAIADKFREETGKRPSVDTFNPDLKINVRIFKNNCTVSLDSSGESLHKRGYRIETGPAPLNEVLAAGMILLADWKGDSNFIDPMCGSGTLPIEAALIAKKIPAGYFRDFYAFQNWKDFDNECWDKVKSEALNKIIPLKHKIVGSDRSGRILKVAKSNVEKAALTNDIVMQVDFIGDVTPPPGPGIMVTNPPYGERIKSDDINKLYKDIGDNLKHMFAGYSAWIISSHMEATNHIGLSSSVRIPLNNGALECKYSKFEIYEGSKRNRPESPRRGEQDPEYSNIKSTNGEKRNRVKRKRINKD